MLTRKGCRPYVFGFPYIYLPSLRWDWVTQPKPPGSITPYAPVNHFYNVKALANASYAAAARQTRTRVLDRLG